MNDLILFGVFAVIAVVHHWLEHVARVKHWHAHWLIWALHPAMLVGMKDWLVHIFVYSKWALLGMH